MNAICANRTNTRPYRRISYGMDVNADALTAALKMAGQDTADMDKTLRVIKTMQAIRAKGATPDTVMSLLAQYDPKYAAMAALLRALQTANPTEQQAEPADKGKQDAKQAESTEPFVQYNHF